MVHLIGLSRGRGWAWLDARGLGGISSSWGQRVSLDASASEVDWAEFRGAGSLACLLGSQSTPRAIFVSLDPSESPSDAGGGTHSGFL